MKSFFIGERVVGPDTPPFVIAEMSGNHNQSLDRALQLVDAAAESGSGVAAAGAGLRSAGALRAGPDSEPSG